MEKKSDSKKKTTPANKVDVPLVTRFSELSKEGKSTREIGELCGVSDTCVRKYLRGDKPPRKYNRTVLSCTSGKPYTSTESTKVTALKEEIKNLKEQVRSNEKKYKKTDDELTKAKSEIRDLTKKYKEATIKSNTYEEEAMKAIDEKTKLNATLQKLKITGHMTKEQETDAGNRRVKEIEKQGFVVSHPDHSGKIYPWSKFYII
jgi:predicted transcriptional regulator